MPSAMSKIKEAFSLGREAIERFQQAGRILSSGPAEFYIARVEEYVDALFGRFAPFKEGDRVELIGAPQTDGTAWHSSSHFLIPGSPGTVCGVDYRDGRFCADVIFDNETWIDQHGLWHPVDEKHTYCLPESLLRRIEGR